MTQQQKDYLKLTILTNKFIPHQPLFQQAHFLTNISEELFYGGAAGGGKSDSLLMAALQYVEEKFIPEDEDKIVYDALIIRRTLDDLEMPNAILDRAKKWLLPFENTGDVIYKDLKKKFIFSSGATLTFRYLAHNNDLNKYQGAELQFIGFDELTQFPENQYLYLHSRLRKTDDNPFPLRMRSASNPGGRGHEWVKARFVKKGSPYPFIASRYVDNIFLNQEDYLNQLERLDELTKRQLLYGDWDLTITKGLLMTLEKLHQNLRNIQDWQPVFSTIGIDPAGSGTDKFSVCLLTYFTNEKLAVVDMMSTPDNTMIEQQVREFILTNRKYNPVLINFEQEPGSRSEDALKYWQGILGDLFNAKQIMDTPSSNTGSKYNRARPHAQLVKEDKLFFNERLLQGASTEYNPLRSLFNQYVYIHPKKEVMKEFDSPDELDSTSYANIAMDQLLNNTQNITTAGRIGA